MTDEEKLEAAAIAAKNNSPVWCGAQVGAWTKERAMINFAHIAAASPDAVLALIAENRRLSRALHDQGAHPDFEYRIERTGRDLGSDWERNDRIECAPGQRRNWKRFDSHEEHHWMRRMST